MNIVLAKNEDLYLIKNIIHTTINEIYPKYYPQGAVEYFLSYHSALNIQQALSKQEIYLLVDNDICLGTGSVNKNELCRMFILPTYQEQGYGSKLMTSLEQIILESYNEIFLDSSLPAYNLYLKRGYIPISFNKILTFNNDYLCYHTMKLSK